MLSRRKWSGDGRVKKKLALAIELLKECGMLLEASSQPSLSGDKRHGALYLCTHIVGLEFLK